jgi:threonine dehydratase
MRLIAETSRTIAEGAGALSLAAAISDPSLEGPIVCVVSGGNIDLAKFAELVTG